MKVLITGALGNLGLHVLEHLKIRNMEITCLVTDRRSSKKKAKRYSDKFEFIYGDIRNIEDVKNAITNKDIILHMAAIVPPRINYTDPNYAFEVNVIGTDNIIQAAKDINPKVKILYTSSVAVFGDVRDRGACVLGPNEPTNPNDNDIYAQQKVKSEENIRNSGLDWSIFRLSFMPNLGNAKVDPMMFEVPLDTNIELLHLGDAALAIANGLEKNKIWNKILHIAGGEKCRITYKEFITTSLTVTGVGMLPENAFGDNDFHCAFFDTEESQKLLQYQNHTFEDMIGLLKKRSRVLKIFATIFRPIVKRYLLRQSPYYNKEHN